MKPLGWHALLIAALATPALARAEEPAAAMARAAAISKAGPGVPLLFGMRRRPLVEGPVVLHLARADQAVFRALEAAGARLVRGRDGRVLGRDRVVAARASVEALERLAALSLVQRIEADGSPLPFPPPLDATAAEVQAPAVWLSKTGSLPTTGEGVRICDIDSGIDVLHPLFFRADGGYHAWIDRDGDGRFSNGIDAVRLADREVALRVLDGAVYGPAGEGPLFGSDSPALDAELDWLYADLDGDGSRASGRGAGFDDGAPSFGEPLFTVDDVNDSGRLDPGEKIVALASSKIAVVRTPEGTFRRGENLIDVPAAGAAHGTASASVLAGGTPGLGRIVGIAPGAELVVAVRGETVDELFALTAWCLSEGARVVLHEYAPWQGFFLDGSSALEQLIDDSSPDGVAHVNPAGNLSTADKLYKRNHPAGSTLPIEIAVPEDAEYSIVGLTVLWREAARPVTLTLCDSAGHCLELPDGGGSVQPWHDGLELYTSRATSSRGTVKSDAYVADAERMLPLPAGGWRIEVADGAAAGAPPLEVIAYAADDVSGWGKGIHFVEHVSEDHLIGHPGTADGGIAVAAYAFHGFWGSAPGERAFYSGRGRRIDGAELLSVAAPEDPIAGNWREGEPPGYQTFGGTSGASPHVAGAAALLLQAHPDYDGGDVRAALRSGAEADDAVGAAPNDDWGYGKLRIHRSLTGHDPEGHAPALAIAPQVVVVGARAAVPVIAGDPDGDLAAIEIDRDYDGRYDETLSGDAFFVLYGAPGVHTHKLRAVDASGREAVALARIEAVRRLEPAGGCATKPARSGMRWLPAFVLMLALGARRWCGRALRRGKSGR